MSDCCRIGVIGSHGVGKTTFCQYLSQQGFYIISLSDVVRRYVQQKRLTENRDILRQCANELKEEFGLDYFARQCVDDASDYSKVVFDSVRHPAEIHYLKLHGVTMIGLDISLDIRYQRIIQRRHDTDFVTLEEFKKQDEYERTGASSGQAINEALLLCDKIIYNDGSLDYFYQVIDQTLECLLH